MNFLASVHFGGEPDQELDYPVWDGRKGHDRFQDLIDSNASAVYTCDTTGAPSYFNKRAAALWGRAPALGDTDDRFIRSRMLYRADDKYLPEDQNPMADVLSGKVSGVYDAEAHVQRPDGKRIVVIVNIAPLIDAEGNIVGAVNSFREKPLCNHSK